MMHVVNADIGGEPPSPRTGKRISGRQRRKAPNHLRAGFLPHRDRRRANAPAPNRGKSRVFRGDEENSSCARLRGGAGRTRTCNHAVMSDTP